MKTLLAIALLVSCSSAQAAVGRHTQTALAAKDINEYETLSEENLVSDEGYAQFRGCVTTKAFQRGSIIRTEDIACISAR